MTMGTAPALPTDRPVTDDELTLLVGQALLYDKKNMTTTLPFQADRNSVLFRLGYPPDSTDAKKFREVNGKDLDERIEELCWRWVVLGIAVPANAHLQFRPTARGRAYLE